MRRNCLRCSYCQKTKDGEYYCNDLDEMIDPCEPVCSDEYYES